MDDMRMTPEAKSDPAEEAREFVGTSASRFAGLGFGIAIIGTLAPTALPSKPLQP